MPEELAERAAGFGYPAMALLDRDGVYGAPRFHLAAKKAGLRAHVGAEITVVDGSRYPVLAESRRGYQNLCRLVTRMKLRAKKGEGAVSPEEMAEYAEGLVCLTGLENGPLHRALERGGTEEARHTAERLTNVFGKKNVFAELARHLDRDEEARNQAVVELAHGLGLPLLATNGVCHSVSGERELLDVFTCIRNKVTLETAGRLLCRNSERFLKPPEEMERLFADLPEAICNTVELSERLLFNMEALGYEFPRYPVPEGETMMSFLRKRTEEGARDRYRPYHEKARRQIARELALIEKLKLEGYFLIVWDIVQFCRREGILVQGRGSAANSAVCYALGITAVDPIAMELLFERFLSEERGEWPDIDLDLPSGDQRERVIQHVYELYGKLGAAMTANLITYRGRSAAREVGKVLGFDEGTLGRLANLVHTFEWHDPKDTPVRQFQEAGLDLDDPRIRKFMELYVAAQDLPRHLGQHSGGMVICQGQLDSIVPLEPATMPGRVVVQWDKDDCADMGIIKVDLLGLGMMAVMEESIKIVREEYREEVDLAHLPAGDPAVYSALQRADTVGIFQVESRAQQASLPRLRPERFYDIVVQVGIIRPGPIVGKMMHPYLRRRQGREKPDCLHPVLEQVLRRTLGVPLFQEQLLRMSMLAAGFTGGEAEDLRRAFSHKRSEERMKEVEVRLRRGMERNGIIGPVQDQIVQSITSFALYGFPESHAASFALLVYASAYLKCHYLAAFTAALLNNQPMGFYHPSTIVKDAQRHGLHFLPVDVNQSDWRCAVDGRPFAVRLGFCYLSGFRKETADAIVRERGRGVFRHAEDLARRVGIRKDELRVLAEAGALNSLSSGKVHRRDALWQVEHAARPAGPLLAGLSDIESGSPLKPMTDGERLRADFRNTGLTIGKHPVSYCRSDLDRMNVKKASELPELNNGQRVRVAGCVIVRQRPGTAKGFVFLSMEDETGIVNVIITPDRFETNRNTVVNEPFLMIEGRLQNLDNTFSVRAERIVPLKLLPDHQISHDFH